MTRRLNSTTMRHTKPTMWPSQKPMATAKWPWRLANRRAAMLKRHARTKRKPTTRRRAQMPGLPPRRKCRSSNISRRDLNHASPFALTHSRDERLGQPHRRQCVAEVVDPEVHVLAKMRKDFLAQLQRALARKSARPATPALGELRQHHLPARSTDSGPLLLSSRRVAGRE